jgi:hypothetical protein
MVAASRYLHTDLSLDEMAELLLAIPSIEAGKVVNKVVSGHGATVGGLSVVYLDARARAMFRDLRADAMLQRG